MRGLTGLAGLVLAAVVLGAAGAAPTPLTFVWPTSVAVEAGGSLLVVESGLHRLVRVNPRSGAETEVASGLTKPYAVASARSGAIFVTDGAMLLRIEGHAAPRKVTSAAGDIGPIAAAPSGDLYFTTSNALYRLRQGAGRPTRLLSGLGAPHGLTVAPDGTVLVSDTDNGRVLRVDPDSRTSHKLMKVGSPRGVVVAADGTLYVVESSSDRVLHFSRGGRKLGAVGPRFGDPYALAIGSAGLYVDDTSAVGVIRLVTPGGQVSTVAAR